MRFLDHTQRRITVGRTSLDEWSAPRRDLFLTTHNTHRQTDIHAPSGIRTHYLSRRAAADLRLRPPGYWDRHNRNTSRYLVFSPPLLPRPSWVQMSSSQNILEHSQPIFLPSLSTTLLSYMNINIQYHKHLTALLFLHFHSLSKAFSVQPCRL